MHTTPDRPGNLKHLLDLAVASDDAGELIEAAGAALGHPLGLVGAGGEALGCAPQHGMGQRALAVARSAARARFMAPPGWDIAAIPRYGTRLGILAIGEDGPKDDGTCSMLGLLPAMLVGQLRRAALIRLQRETFVHRLVCDPALVPHRARREAEQLGVRLAGAYWPGILYAPTGELRADVVEKLEHEVRSPVEGSLTTVLSGQLLVLHPGELAGARDPGPAEWFRQVAERARAVAPSSQAQLIAGERAVELGALSAYIVELEQLHRLGPRARGDVLVVWGREYALDRLMHRAVEPEIAAGFVEQELGSLLRWDQQNRTDLLRVLEASLDFPRHDEAARRCFMHRNTFRHRLRLALDVLGRRLENPDVRLAVHVALKLRRLTDQARDEPAGGATAAPAGARATSSRGRRGAARRGGTRPRTSGV